MAMVTSINSIAIRKRTTTHHFFYFFINHRSNIKIGIVLKKRNPMVIEYIFNFKFCLTVIRIVSVFNFFI